MKTINLVLIFFLCVQQASAQSYIPFPSDSGATWTYGSDENDPGLFIVSEYSLHLDGKDTSIDGYRYHELLSRQFVIDELRSGPLQFIDGVADSADTIYGYIREESKKVYLRLDSTEYLLYDFSANVGDAVNLYLDNNDTISSIDSFIVGGVYHKVFNLKYNGQYVEGIGRTTGSIFDMYQGELAPYYLLCFTNGSEHYTYYNDSCYTIYTYGTTLNVNNINNNNAALKLYPNPFSNELITESAISSQRLTIYNSIGIPLISQQLKQSNNV